MARKTRHRSSGSSSKGGSSKVLKYGIPLAVGAGILLWLGSANAAPPEKTVITPPPPPPPPPPNRQRGPSGAPEGSGRATVRPIVLPGDPAKFANGLLLHTQPSAASPLIGPEDSSQQSRHANTGDRIAILRTGIQDAANPKQEWWQIMQPLNVVGFVHANDARTAGLLNFSDVVLPTVQATGTAGVRRRLRSNPVWG